MSTDGRTDVDAHGRAEFLARLIRVAGPAYENLPSGALKRDFSALIRKHGTDIGISLTIEPRGTLLDAKLELDARVEELAIPHYSETVTPAQYRALTEGTSICREQIEIVTRHSLGRHIRAAKRLPVERVAAGYYACGIIVGALAESWRY